MSAQVNPNSLENKLSNIVIASAIEVHRVLGGPGLLESVYEDALAHELTLRGIPFKRQLLVPVLYKDVQIKNALRLDLLVGDSLVVEVKANENQLKIFSAQTLTYLRITQKRLGLVLNFGQRLLRDGITRVINDF